MEAITDKNFTIVRAKLSEQIADRLEDMILNEELEDSEKLPSEQTLAENFNVSKNVVRESLNTLKERGLVETRNGAGNYVTKPKADNLSDVISRMIVLDNIDYRQIYDTRIVLETSACRRAARRITDGELAKLEKLPIEKLIGNSFGSLFSNMDSKWLRSYERATLYGEKLEIIDYSPEIDTYLKVICFPTFRGHCGCILFNIEEIQFTKNSSDAEKALMLYFGKLPERYT